MRQSSIASVCMDGISQTRMKAMNSSVATVGFSNTPLTSRHGHERCSGRSRRTRHASGRPARNTVAGYAVTISRGAMWCNSNCWIRCMKNSCSA